MQLVSEFCKLDLMCPVPGCGQQEMRILLLEGPLKLKDRDSKVGCDAVVELVQHHVSVVQLYSANSAITERIGS